jgi:membrane protease subunit HflC
MSKASYPTLIIAGLVVVVLLAYAFTYQVAFNEVAVKVRLGKADESSILREPGLKFRWPWPVESIKTYDTRLQTMDTPETEIKTIDGKNVIMGAYAVWRIKDPLTFYQRVRTVEEAERQMRARISQAQATVVGQRELADFVNLDAQGLDESYDAMLHEMQQREAPQLLADYGIEVVEVGVRRISLPKEVTQEVFKSMIQERRELAEKYRGEGKSRAAAIESQAEAEAKQILAFAGRKAQEIRSAGIQASTQLLARINDEDRAFFEWLRYLDAIRASLKQRTTIFIDQNWPIFDPFVNPPVPIGGADQEGR